MSSKVKHLKLMTWKKKETNRQSITKYDDKTEIWEKDSSGRTTKEGHRTHYHDSGNVTDHNGKIISNTKKGESYSNDSSSSSSSEGCFLTTACVNAKGLSDDCQELKLLRQLRDDYVSNLQNGGDYIKKYYEISPFIVRKIESLPNSIDILNEIYSNLIRPSIELIKTNQNYQAFNLYKNYVEKLKKEYIEN